MHTSVVDGLLQKCDWPGGYGQSLASGTQGQQDFTNTNDM